MGSSSKHGARLISLPRPALIALATVRARLRASEIGMTLLATGVGALAGLCVAAMTTVVNAAHMLIYGIPFDVRLSAAERVTPLAAFAAPMLGGLVLGAIDAWLARKNAAPAVDPVEANALRGGRMSLGDSVLVATQTLISNGCGASVGLEAGYAQIGAGVASYLGVRSRLRRQDLRMLVGCGAGGAIAAAFGAPLTGAFYAFELIIGAYSLANAVPVFAATLAASLTTQAIIGAPYEIGAPIVAPLTFPHYGALIGLGLVAAAIGVGAMRVAALIERGFRAAVPWRLVRPAVGGLIVGAMALYTPQVLGAGHGALGLDFYWPLTAAELTILIVLKLTRVPRFAGVRVPRGIVFRLAVRRLAHRQALFDRRRRRGAGHGPRNDRLRAGRHGRAQRGDRRRAADHDLSRARKHRKPRHRGRRPRRFDRDHPRGARHLRLFVHHLAPAPARRDDPRRPGRRLAARSDGRAHDDPLRLRSFRPTNRCAHSARPIRWAAPMSWSRSARAGDTKG